MRKRKVHFFRIQSYFLIALLFLILKMSYKIKYSAFEWQLWSDILHIDRVKFNGECHVILSLLGIF